VNVTAHPHPLIDVPSLAHALGIPLSSRAVSGPSAPGEATVPVVLDVRWRLGGPPGVRSYREGHLPGAVFLDLDAELCGPAGPGGRHPLPSPASFQEVMRRAGVSAGRPVVVYDDDDATAAARAWWTLRYFGHGTVRVLDGGYRAWSAAGLPVEAGDGTSCARGDFTAVPGGMAALDAAGAARLAGMGALLDARAAARYRGEVEPVDPVAGHIPGAVSAPTAGNVAGDGRFKSPAELRARLASFGVRADRMAGVYCGSGVTAAHEVLALTLAGLPAALYVGSWSEWVTDPARPVAVGPAEG
jgi:thiosulfate/3-mercaptopyruvate sulfurtransferase